MAAHEKRAITRYQVEIDMLVTANGRETAATTLNLSLGGALIRMADVVTLQLGDRVQVSFRLPELSAPVIASAEIRWVGDLDDAMLGVQFVTGFRAKETWALGRFLERQKPL